VSDVLLQLSLGLGGFRIARAFEFGDFLTKLNDSTNPLPWESLKEVPFLVRQACISGAEFDVQRGEGLGKGNVFFEFENPFDEARNFTINHTIDIFQGELFDGREIP
jgi:hypothetical protein